MSGTLTIPTLAQAEAFLSEAAALNPGPWVQHSRYVAQAAEALARHHPELDADAAHILGLLHDIGRREGVTNGRHALDGYRYLAERGFADAARICLTHSFHVQDIRYMTGEWDCTPEELAFIARTLAEIAYTPYDRLIQLCDALALPSGFCLIEKRLVDVSLRYGTNEYTVRKWRAILQIQRDFEQVLGRSIYSLLPGVVENTFGVEIAELTS